jgi:nucleotide-binding universal stress UspA family protein
MNKRILLGIDTNFSPSTQQALRVVSDFMQQAAPELRLVLLSVIAVPSTSSPSLGLYVGHLLPMSITPEQRDQAEEVLNKARVELQKGGIAAGQIEVLIRIGFPAEEIAKAAKDLSVTFIVVGSRGDALRQKIRRFLVGSTSRSVLHAAPCPVMIASLPQAAHSADLVTWYEQAITTYLEEHTHSLTVFTPAGVAQKFVPPRKKTPGRKEIAAATLALEHLAGKGRLCCHNVKGELRYVND